ncbi:hypothetical protein AMS68_004237 [Peltaster fructicola]|uniref:FAD-binding PCMH-type domain-containing protein n=1 Tax=Peltaster fructicola TaxID=286661 RepID=A0A6H0XW92_9PEZI|nr:hypothetical protein AMS68_004237 [Peltaster fructicola]
MGAVHSVLQKQIIAALGSDDTLYAFAGSTLYQYEDVRRYNLDITTIPLAVTYPRTTAQVAAIVKIAASAGLKVQPKSGGHSYANYSSPDGGIVIDLKHFQRFEMDTTKWFATVGAGTLLGELDSRLAPYNRAVAHGTCPQVGIGGHATIGGLGPASRLFGTTLDHIEEVEVVLADGSIKRASAKENTDLFWALRGAAASFGVITEFILHTHPAPGEMVQFTSSFTKDSWEDMAQAFKVWQRYVLNQPPNKFASTATILEAGMSISGMYFGSKEEFKTLMDRADFPIQAQIEKTIVFRDWLGTVEHWAVEVAVYYGGGLPAHAYTKSLTFGQSEPIPETVIDDMFKYIKTTKRGTPVWFIIFDLAGGAVNEIAMDATAFAHRDALFYLQAYAISLVGPVSDVTKSFLTGLNKLITGEMRSAGEKTDFGAYAGYVDPELPNPQEKYWGSNLPRLEELKSVYDAHDVFHNPQSVRPGGKEVLPMRPIVTKKSFWSSLFRR